MVFENAMADTFEAHEDKVTDFRGKLHYIDGACGLAVAVDAKIVAVDLFDKPTTCRKVWDRLLSGYVLDALEAELEPCPADSNAGPHQVGTSDVERLLGAANAMPWH